MKTQKKQKLELRKVRVSNLELSDIQLEKVQGGEFYDTKMH